MEILGSVCLPETMAWCLRVHSWTQQLRQNIFQVVDSHDANSCSWAWQLASALLRVHAQSADRSRQAAGVGADIDDNIHHATKQPILKQKRLCIRHDRQQDVDMMCRRSKPLSLGTISDAHAIVAEPVWQNLYSNLPFGPVTGHGSKSIRDIFAKSKKYCPHLLHCVHVHAVADLLQEVQVPKHLLNVLGGVLIPALRLDNHLVLPNVWGWEQPRSGGGRGLDGPQQVVGHPGNVKVVS